MNFSVFASGRGSNFSAIEAACKRGYVKAKLALLVCDNPDAPVIKKAKKAGIKTALIERKDFLNKGDFEKKIIEHLRERKIDFIVLAGFMRLLGPDLLKAYKGKIINIHPSLLPSFKGTHGIKDAFEYGVKVTGVSVHFVDEELDHGPIILQESVSVKDNDTAATLEARIHKVEHRLYPLAIKLYSERKLTTKGRKVKIVR